MAYTESIAEEEFSRALRRLAKAVSEYSGRFVSMRDVKIFRGDEIFVIKPLALRTWTRTAALNDADEIAAAILASR